MVARLAAALDVFLAQYREFAKAVAAHGLQTAYDHESLYLHDIVTSPINLGENYKVRYYYQTVCSDRHMLQKFTDFM